MPERRTALGVVLALATASLPASRAFAQEPAEADEVAVRTAFNALQAAVEAKDTARLALLVHPRFTMQHALGQVDTRSVWLKLVAGGRLARQVAERREYDPEVVIAGDTALIRSLVRLRYPDEGRVAWLRSTAVFVREGGRWLQLNQQSSHLHDGPVQELDRLADFAGAYAIPNREGFSIRAKEDYLELTWASGAVLPLFPDGGDRFGSGPTSTVSFTRTSAGAVEGAERRGSDGAVWWTARRMQ
jgi:ketosteroid isomerase-like protein